MTIQETLKRHNLKIKRGFDMDTVTVTGADPEQVYRELADAADGYTSIDRMGKLIILHKGR